MKRLTQFFALVFLVLLLSRISFPFNLVSDQYPHAFNVDPQLPNVLLLGDSTQIRYYPLVKQALKGRVNVCQVVELAPQRWYSLIHGGPLLQPVNAASTRLGKGHLDEWLSDIEWDAIHFNWGLHDLLRSGEGTDARRLMKAAIQSYRGNLQFLCARLKQTEAQLVLATTTPVPSELGYLPGVVEVLNEVARSTALENGIVINDLYAATSLRLAELQYWNDVHFNDLGTEVLASDTVSSILAALGHP